MLSLDLGRGIGGSGCSESAKIDRLRAVSTGLTLGLEMSTSGGGWMRTGLGGVVRPSGRGEEESSRALDLLPRGPPLVRQSTAGAAPPPPPPISCVITRQPLFVTTSSGANNPGSANDCETENHSSSRGGSPSPRGIDMNEIPADAADVPSPRSCSISPPNGGGAFAFDISRKGESSSVNIKRERERLSDGEADRANCEVSSRGSDEEDGGPRKKLRLSKEQAAVLEESFKEHSTLNPKQKNALAKQLGLRPRQVEVWFQNRRARTKLKQTEIDCELLKRCCETLTEENRRLQKEVQELRAIKVPPPCVISQDFYMPLPAATLTMCPSCERLAPVDVNRSGHHLPPPFATKAHHHPGSGFATAHFPPQPPAACQS